MVPVLIAIDVFILGLSFVDGFRKVIDLEQGSLKTEKDNLQFQHHYFVKEKEKFVSQPPFCTPRKAIIFFIFNDCKYVSVN